MLEVETSGQPGRTAIRSGRKRSEAVAGPTSQAFARWLYCCDELMQDFLCHASAIGDGGDVWNMSQPSIGRRQTADTW